MTKTLEVARSGEFSDGAFRLCLSQRRFSTRRIDYEAKRADAAEPARTSADLENIIKTIGPHRTTNLPS